MIAKAWDVYRRYFLEPVPAKLPASYWRLSGFRVKRNCMDERWKHIGEDHDFGELDRAPPKWLGIVAVVVPVALIVGWLLSAVN